MNKLLKAIETWRSHGKPAGRTDAVGTLAAQADKNGLPALSTEPDCPQPFGYKTGWLALRCDDPARVISVLGLSSPTPANWETGLAQAERTGGIFVSPSLSEWVLAIGVPEYDEGRLEAMASAVAELHCFFTHRVPEYHRWAKYVNGALVRAYGYIGERGEVLWDDGGLTPEEAALGFDDFPNFSEDWSDAARVPDEEDVLDIAAAWGVDPRFEKRSESPGVGWVCEGATGGTDDGAAHG